MENKKYKNPLGFCDSIAPPNLNQKAGKHDFFRNRELNLSIMHQDIQQNNSIKQTFVQIRLQMKFI